MAKDTSGTAARFLSAAPTPPARQPAEPEPAAAPVPEPEPAEEVAAPPPPSSKPSARPRRPAPTAAPSSPSLPGPQRIPLREQRLTQTRIPAALFEQVRAAKDASGDTHESWFLDAFDAVSDLLDDHYRPGPARRTRMPARRRRTRRPTREPLVSYPLRLTDEELAVLTERADEVGPPSMADFVTTIVRLRLEQLEHGDEPD